MILTGPAEPIRLSRKQMDQIETFATVAVCAGISVTAAVEMMLEELCIQLDKEGEGVLTGMMRRS